MPLTLTTTLSPSAVLSMDRLNSFMRSSGRGAYGDSFYHHVYQLKDLVVRQADEAGLVTARLVYVDAKCRRCGGTGEWRGRYERDNCWHCGGSGKQRLYFREHCIGRTLRAPDWPLENLIWHKPMYGVEPENRRRFVSAGDWKPQAPGKDLTPEEVAEALNSVEAEIESKHWAADRYHLVIGRDEGECRFCDSTTEDRESYIVSRGRLIWGSRACASCRKHYQQLGIDYGNTMLIYSRFPLPKEFPTPAIGAWCERHGGVDALVRVKAGEEVLW